jgi:hypothetical protein
LARSSAAAYDFGIVKETRMIRLSKTLFIAACSLATTGVAFAQDDAAPEPAPEEMPPEPVGDAPAPPADAPPLTLAKGKIVIAGSTLNFNLSADAFGEPVSLAPSVWYGVDDKITIGLTHDGGTTPWSPRPAFRSITATDLMGNPVTFVAGSGICLTGDESGCTEVYDNVGFDALYALKQGKLTVAAHPGLDIVAFDPFLLSLRLGVLGRYMVDDKISIVFDPRLQFGITERDAGNKEGIDLPVWAWYAVDAKISAYVHTGINGRFEEFGDNFGIPLQLGGNYKVNEQITAGLDFGFTRLNDGFDGRVLGLRLVYAL